MSVVGPILAIASAALGICLLRAAWSPTVTAWARQRLTLAGWLTLLGGVFAWHSSGGLAWDKAMALATLGPPVIAFLVLVRQSEWRANRPNARRTTTLPYSRPAMMSALISSRQFGRGVARVVVAGPLALIAASGLTVITALRAPWLDADRLVAAGFLLPVAWAIGAAWATMATKLARVAVVLSSVAVVCFGGAVL